MKKIAEMSRNKGYTRGNLLDYSYQQKYYKPIGIVLSRQTNTTIPQQTNFTEKLREDNGASMQKTILNFRLINHNIII